jgi:DNA-directed RNA polymerase subunit N
MILPIRCFTCSKVIANKWTRYEQRVLNGEDKYDVLDNLGINRDCCRLMFVTHVNLIDTLILYPSLACNKCHLAKFDEIIYDECKDCMEKSTKI